MSERLMSSKNKDLYEFGEFRLDARARMLYHDGAPVALKPKVVETLVVLIENADEIVGKSELMNAVWHDSFVEENNLSVNIYALRKAFARLDGEKTYIQTVPRRGFRFVVPVSRIVEANGDRKTSELENNLLSNQLIEESINAKISPGENHSPNGETVGATRVVLPPLPTVEPTRVARTARYPFDRRNLTAVVLLILCVAVGGSLYALHVRTQQRVESKTNGAERDVKAERGTENIEAYQFYLRGRELWQTRNNLKMEEGIKFFRRAIELDPNFAAPHIGIADSLSMMRNDPGEWRVAEEYAAKALRLAPDSADAHATLGFIHAMNKWQWRESEAYFQKALALDDDSGKAHQWYATLLLLERRFPEAEAHLKRAIEIEPLSPNYNIDLCELYLLTKRDEEMFAQCRHANEINPDFQYVFYERAIYERQKRYDEAAEAWIKAHARFGIADAETRRGSWYRAFQKDGFRGWMLADIEGNKKSSDVLLGVWNTSVAYAKLEMREKTLETLEKAYQGKTFSLPFANVNPEFDFLRADPQFQDLMRRINLP